MTLETIRTSWGWVGLDPAQVVATNAFGNMIVLATNGAIWRICPEELSCQQVAHSADEFAIISQDPAFQLDWEMVTLVDLAKQHLGSLEDGRCYCLKLAAVIGGSYQAANMGTISLDELISFSGYLAQQIKDIPEGIAGAILSRSPSL